VLSSPVANLVKRQICCSASLLQHYQSCSRSLGIVAAIAIASLVGERIPICTYSTSRHHSVRLFRVRLPKASQLGQKGPVVRKQAWLERRLTVRSSEIRCSVSPWRCGGRAPLGPIGVEFMPSAHAHPHRAGTTPSTTKTPGVDLHECQCVPCPLCRRR
jgi:hypothetical protein